MARIPQASVIQRRIPSGEAPVVQAPNVGAQVGQALRGVVGDIQDVRQSKLRFQATVADATFRTEQLKIESEFQDDNEFDKFGQKYDERISKAIQSASEGIGDPQTRNMFMEQAKVAVEQGRIRVNNLANTKEKDYNRGIINEALTAERENALQGDMTQSLENVRSMVASAIDAGYMTNEEGARTFDSWRQDTAVGRIQMMDPDQQIQALDQPWANNIPSDTKAKLLRDATAKTRVTKAVDTVNMYVDKGLDTSQAMAAARADAKGDADLQRMIEDEYAQRRARLEQAGRDQQNKLFQSLAFKIDQGDVSYNDISPNDLQTLTNAQRDQLRSDHEQRLASSQGAAPMVSNTAVFDRLSDFKTAIDSGQTGALEEAGQYFTENYAQLSKRHREYWSKFLDSGVMPPEAQSQLNDDKFISATLGRLQLDKGTKDFLADDLTLRYDDYRKSVIESTGKPPSDSDRQQFIDANLVEMDLNGWWPGGVRKAYEVEGLDPLSVRAVINVFKQENGRMPTPSELGDRIKESGLTGG